MTTCSETRTAIRNGMFTGTTAGLCPGVLQANIVILPKADAEEFLGFCLSNPRPCPLVGMGEAGDPALPELGRDIDIRTDLPGYILYEDGKAREEMSDIGALWRDDLVTFALGCSFTFETALARAGIPMRHIEAGTTVPMFRTEVMTTPNAVFGGELVVSARPVPRARAGEVREICARYPYAHGAPVHIGDPAALGIADTARPDWGQPLTPGPDDVWAFWACGVTSQAALMAARLPFAITHRPGAMLITEVPEDKGVLLGSGLSRIDA